MTQLQGTLVRRSAYIKFRLTEQPLPDLASIVGGATASTECQWEVLSAVTGRTLYISNELVAALRIIPSDSWVSPDHALTIYSYQTIKHLIDIGLVLCSPAEGALQIFAEREQRLRESAWHPISAIHHFCTKWTDVHLNVHVASDVIEVAQTDEDRARVFNTFIDSYGMPPSHFPKERSCLSSIELPFTEDPSDFFDILKRRRTSRIFDQSATLPLATFGLLCRYTFGPFGIFEAHPGIYGLGKTSPSGGGLHPTGVYILIIRIQGVAPGIYFYDQEHHTIRLLISMTEDDAVEQANILSAGQQFPRTSAAVFLLTSRFYRNFWKYRRHPKAYAVLHMDIAHLSQTFYLVCEKLGLGAFFTAAVNAGNIESILGLDPYEEGALAMLGCGISSHEQLGLRVDFEPFSPS